MSCDAGGTKNCNSARACVLKETSCSDGLDNDGDGASDCNDLDCAGRSCDAVDATRNCGRSATVLACVGPETICDNGIDDDGDGFTDCLDTDCNAKVCSTGTAAGTCSNKVCGP